MKEVGSAAGSSQGCRKSRSREGPASSAATSSRGSSDDGREVSIVDDFSSGSLRNLADLGVRRKCVGGGPARLPVREEVSSRGGDGLPLRSRGGERELPPRLERPGARRAAVQPRHRRQRLQGLPGERRHGPSSTPRASRSTRSTSSWAPTRSSGKRTPSARSTPKEATGGRSTSRRSSSH